MCELQVLDNTHQGYARLKPQQYHGSVYGQVAARRGYLRPVGTWNFQQVTVKGPHIKVELKAAMIPVNLVAEIMGVGFDYGMSPAEIARAVVEGHQVLWTREADVELRSTSAVQP